VTIDAHVHIWDLDRAEYPWLTADVGTLHRSIDFAEIEPQLAARDITGAILVQASDEAGDTQVMLDAAAQHPEILGVVAWTPLHVPASEIADPQALAMRLTVNGVIRQNGSTATMVFGVHYLVWYLSQFMVLNPGDVINTGTPAGVALGLADHPYLRAGDVMELEIAGLGKARQTLVQA